jgi:putative inorganic carbon (HCO3(-)) transporter
MKKKGHDPKQSYAWLVWLEPALVLLLAPVFLFPSPHRSILFLFMPLIFVLHFFARRRIVEPSPANAPLGLLMFMVLVSLCATYDVSFSLPKVAGVLLGAAVFFVILNVTSSSRLLAQVLAVSILGMVALSMLGLLGTQWSPKVPILGSITAHLPPLIKGVPGAEEGFPPNAIGGTLILFLPLQIVVLLSSFRDQRKKPKLVLATLASIFITAGVLLLTQSRGAWIGLAVALLLLFAWMGRWGKWLALAVVVAGTILVFRVGPQKVGDSVMTGIGGAASFAPTMEVRSEIWNRAIYGISDFPFTGMGMNTFRKVVNVLYPLFLIPPDVDIASCHNQLLQTALDLGIPGLVAYVALLAVAMAMGIQVWRRAKEFWIRASAQGLVCGIVAQQVFGITDAIPLGAKVGIFFWVALGILAAMHRQTQIEDANQRSGRRWREISELRFL